MAVNHGRDKNEQGIRMGTKENMTQIKSSRARTKRLLSHRGSLATDNNNIQGTDYTECKNVLKHYSDV